MNSLVFLLSRNPLPIGEVRHAGVVSGGRALLFVTTLFVSLSATTTAAAHATTAAAHVLEKDSGSEREIEVLRKRVAELEHALASAQTQYEARLAAIEQQMAGLLAGATTMPGRTPAAPSTTTLASGDPTLPGETRLAVASGDPTLPVTSIASELEGVSPSAVQTPGEQRFESRTRNLNELNPEISVTGDVFATWVDRTGDLEGNRFRFAEFETGFQAPLDPYSLAKFFVVQEEGEFQVEEGYIEWPALPGGIGVKVGQFRYDFGKLNRWHQHALPQADRPLVSRAIWGEEGIRGLGASLSWLPPPFLGHYNEIWVHVTNDENDASFSGKGFDEPVFMVHETNYWDLSDATYLELGLSWANGVNDLSGDFRTNVFGVDWNLGWQPPAQALYRGFELRGELLWQRRDTDQGNIDSVGTYTYGTFKLDRRWFAGVRGDWTELPEEPGDSLWAASPYIEWWQSEWARFRFQYSYSSRQLEEPEPEHRFFFQITWSIGPHKHEKY